MSNCGCGKEYTIHMGCCQPVLGPVENYYTKHQIDKIIEDIEESGCCITADEVDEKIDDALEPYATEQWVLDKHYISGVDLSDYASKSAVTQEISAAVSGKQDTLTAGSGISIVNNVISATGGVGGSVTYTLTSRTAGAYPSGILRDGDSNRVLGTTIASDVSDGNTIYLRFGVHTYLVTRIYDDGGGSKWINFQDSSMSGATDIYCAQISDSASSPDAVAVNPIQGKLTAGSNITISGNTISATDTTYTHFAGATASADGVQGLVPGPLAGDQDKFLKGDGTWAAVQSGGTYTAGNGISIDANNEISVDTTVVATQNDLAGKQDALTAGTNISISSNTISVTGMPVLYATQGQNTDGAVTQKLFTETVGDVESILQTLNSGAGV